MNYLRIIGEMLDDILTMWRERELFYYALSGQIIKRLGFIRAVIKGSRA
jgi:hypothetical protein